MRIFQIVPILLLVAAGTAMAQRDLVPATNPVYGFLLRQELRGTIHGFQWGMLPLSRKDIAGFLDSLQARVDRGDRLPGADNGILQDLRVEFSYDLRHSLDSSSSLIPGFQLSGIFDNDRQKYLYAYADSTASVFIDGFADWSYRVGNDQTPDPHFASLGEIGVRLRGTLFDRLGYFIQASNGVLFSGSKEFALLDPRLQANAQFNRHDQDFFDFTNGYLRYDADWLSVTFGREQLLWGMGYMDRAVLSNNTVPFDFAKIDLRSNSVHYSFLHGSLVGADSNGKQLASKYIAAHRLEFNAGRRVRIGLNEAILYSNQPINFTMLNPLIFLTSAELSTEMPSTGEDAHNSLIWLDLEVTPARNLRLFGSFLIDDLKFSTINATDITRNTNKFGWQLGALWNDALMPGLVLSGEYSRINPFVGSHWTDQNSYANWSLPLGEKLQPNSDEWRFRVDYAPVNRLLLSGEVHFQRTGENIVDPATGRIIFDAGSDLLRGENQLVHTNYFLQGNRVNRTLLSFTATWQPIRQYFIDVKVFASSIQRPDQGMEEKPVSVWGTIRVEY